MVTKEFIQEQAERLFDYFQAKNLTLGMTHYPSLSKLKVLIKELCDIAEEEGSASDVYISVHLDDDNELVVRPLVKIRSKKGEDENE